MNKHRSSPRNIRRLARGSGASAGRLLANLGFALLLALTAWLPAAPAAMAQAPDQPGVDTGSAVETPADPSQLGAPDAVTAGAAGYVYALPAKNTKLFYRYDISANTWTRMADIPANVYWGGALTTDGTYIYALPANDTQLFYRYDIAANTWTARANIPAKVKEGGALTFDGTYVYALSAKNTKLVYRYDKTTNTWTARSDIPSNVSKTGALTRLGTSIYGLPSNDTQAFYRYDFGADTWTSQANIPAKVKEGGALTNDGTYLYALSAKGTNLFYRYDPGANTWTARANLPAAVSFGGALTYDGVYVYAVRAGDSASFYRYDIAANTWSTRANVPAKVKEGGALVFVPPASSVTLTPDNQGQGVPGQERIYAHVLTVTNLTSVFNLATTSSNGWTVTVYKDVNGNGVKDTGDDPITATPSIGPNATYNLLLGVQVPSGAPLGDTNLATVTATAVTGGATASATDTTTVGQQISVQPNYTRNVVAGMVSFYGHTVTNNGDQADQMIISATSSQGWTVLLWEDTNHNGVHETNNPNEPAVSNPVSLNPGQTYWLVAEIQTPGNAAVGTVDQTVIQATGQGGAVGTATDTSTVVSNAPPVIDGKYDDVYNNSPNSDVVCYNDSTGKVFGKLATFYIAGSDAVYMVLAIDKDFVDNTYGTNAIGWPSGHTFNNLVGSDHALFYGYNAGGTKVLDFKDDYITANPGGTTTDSGYSTLGVLGGEGQMNLGSAASILEWGTSIDYSLNDLDYCAGGNCSILGTNLLVNSPATDAFYTPNPTYPDWIYDVIYELKINANAFPGGFGRMEVPYIHASPSKVGTNTIIPTPGECPGEIGDYVWHDADRDKLQDGNEQGIDNVQVQLYLDDGDGIFEPSGGVHSDSLQGTKTTTAGGKYLFQDLPAADYWVHVVESTVPAGYATTTYNSPMLVHLDAGESFLDADFGYAIPSTLDYGDAPDTGVGTGAGNYNTTSADNGPRHTLPNQVGAELHLGVKPPDGDSGFLQNVDATADDLLNVDDEDGVAVLPQITTASTQVDLTVAVTNFGSNATLACWIDFNRNGVFGDAGERASMTVPSSGALGTTTNYTLSFTGFAAPQVGTSYLRCRTARDAGEVANPTGAAATGEVEDYRLTIGPQPDYGDAPDVDPNTGPGNYQTRASDGGPSHAIVNNLRLGTVAPDGDNGTLQNVPADADDTTNTDDEDGVTALPTIYNTTTSVTLAVSVFNDTGSNATVACWIDFNRDGDFGDTGERQSATVIPGAGQQTANLTFSGFAAPQAGDTYLRCRLASSAIEVNLSTGAAASGEVEDYKITILGLDYGDAPDAAGGTGPGNYNTVSTDNGPSHLIISGLNLGSIAPDADPGTLQNVDASADDGTGLDDEDGVQNLPAIGVGSTSVAMTVNAVNATGALATVACWIDFNQNGIFGDPGERVSTTMPTGSGPQVLSLTFTGFAAPTAGDTYLRCRIASVASEVDNPTGAANSGEVEDYHLTVSPQQTDYGDAPDSYHTTSGNNGASHTIVPGLWLGIEPPDGDDGTLQDVAASLDDNTGPSADDEDGVNVAPDMATGAGEYAVLVSANNNTGSPASLVCWADFNRDGDFLDTGEMSQVETVTSQGVFLMGFNGFGTPVTGQSYLRCRIVTNPWTPTPVGPASSGEVEDYTFQIIPSDANKFGQVGNYIWVDENSDGYQDAGEPGIPNVVVVLYGISGVELARTVTDIRGQYLFPRLQPGTYYVDVFDGTGGRSYSLPYAGMVQTPPPTLPFGDFGNQSHDMMLIPRTGFTGYPVTVLAGGENLTADFGYNYNPPGDVNGNTGDGALGDRVWIDTDGDGKQDSEELGIPNVTLMLYYDPDGDGVYNTPYPGGTTTSNATGYYIFDNLPTGAYVVQVVAATLPSGYSQTGDPDSWGVWCGSACDNKTTMPVVIGPGDVFLNADFGYQPPASDSNSIGDKIWLDADADQIGPPGAPGGTDTNEYGIPGVTVELIRDINNNGIWDANEPIVATDVTDSDGFYLFSSYSGVPDGSYLVWVSDTDNVLAGLKLTYDPDGGGDPVGSGAPLGQAATAVKGLSSVLNLGVGNPNPVSNLLQDFAFTPAKQQPNLGLIGDRVWLDNDGDGVQDANEPGLEGIQVALLDGSSVQIGATVTNENGNYYFPNLPGGTYTVVVTPPTGMNQTYDADGLGTPNRSTVTIANGGVNLLQDFGYRGLGVVGNLVWEDLNANGVVDGGEAGIPSITLDLYWDLNGDGQVDPGEPLIGSATTGATGGYTFQGLPTNDGNNNANYVVRVTDNGSLLLGYWHSLGTPGVDNNSQTDPYGTVLTPSSPSNLTADFGYYIKPAAVGNWVWSDNNNGIQEVGETGLAYVIVKLQITYPMGQVAPMYTQSSASVGNSGWYGFGNLLLDEDYNGDNNPPEPAHLISINTGQPALGGASPSPINAPGSTQFNDSNNPAGTSAQPHKGETDVSFSNDLNPIASYDFGFWKPLAVALANFQAEAQDGQVLVTWETASELNNAGFNLYRGLSADGARTLVASVPSQAPGSAQGASYSYGDAAVTSGQTYWYWLEDVDVSGATGLHGPVSVDYQVPTAVTLDELSAEGGVANGAPLWALGLLAILAAPLAMAALRRRRAAS